MTRSTATRPLARSAQGDRLVVGKPWLIQRLGAGMPRDCGPDHSPMFLFSRSHSGGFEILAARRRPLV